MQIGSPCRERESCRESPRESAPESVREIAKMAKRKWRCNWIGRFRKIYAGCKAFVEQTKRTNFLIKIRRKLQSSTPNNKIPFDQFWNKHDQHMINSNFNARFSIPRKQTDLAQLTRIAILIYTLWCLPGVHCPQSKHTLFWQFSIFVGYNNEILKYGVKSLPRHRWLNVVVQFLVTHIMPAEGN